jgi:hypothetical protein
MPPVGATIFAVALSLLLGLISVTGRHCHLEKPMVEPELSAKKNFSTLTTKIRR